MGKSARICWMSYIRVFLSDCLCKDTAFSKNNFFLVGKNFRKPFKKFPKLGVFFISNLKIYISRLEMKFSSGFGKFSGGEGRFFPLLLLLFVGTSVFLARCPSQLFHPLGNADGNGEFCTLISGVWFAAERFSEKSSRRPIVFRPIRGLIGKSKK